MKKIRLLISNLRYVSISGATILLLVGFATAQVSSGGDFTLEQKVISGGGGTSSDATSSIFRIDGTIGQPAAGTQMSGGDFTQTGGFWAFRPLSPTAASVPVSGRVTTARGMGISGVTVTIVDATGGSQTVQTNAFGYFSFTAVPVGQTLILSVEHRKYSFSPAALALDLVDEVDDIQFVGR